MADFISSSARQRLYSGAASNTASILTVVSTMAAGRR